LRPQRFAGYDTPAEQGPYAVTAATPLALGSPIVYGRLANLSGNITSNTGAFPSATDVSLSFTGYDHAGQYYTGSTLVTGGLGAYTLTGIPLSSADVTVDTFVPGFGYSVPRSVHLSGTTAGATLSQDWTFEAMGSVSGYVTLENGTPAPRSHLTVYVNGDGGSTYYACIYYDTPYDSSECYSDPLTGAFSVQVMAGSATVSVTTPLPTA
jgi:hypothetical protein